MEEKELFKFNEWWETGKVSEKNLEAYKRYLFYKILNFIEDRQIILITGLRRVGKTKLLYQIIHSLLEKKIDPKKILYFSFDEEAFDIKDVLETYKKVLKKDFKDVDRIYVFFDEVHKCKDWENKIKVYYDLNPNIKFFLSGSASLIISKQAKESLAGRIYEFILKPLTFKEFLEMKNVKISFEEAKLFNEKILLYFVDFVRKAGFPEIINEDNDEKIRTYVKLSVVERIIYKDIPKQFGKTDIELLEILTNMFFKNPGLILNFENLSKNLRRDKKTLMNYVYYLKFSLLINLVSNFRISVLATSRKNKKVYPAASSLIFSSYGMFDSNIWGKVLECIFCNETEAKYYFRKDKKEIDFLIFKNNKIIPVEIKYSISETEIKDFISLLKSLNINAGIVLTFDKFAEIHEKNFKILVYPLWVYLLFGDRILEELCF
ncbi:MAG: ATP-binding protein [Candidatus Aenigmatarchaeota archaeon]